MCDSKVETISGSQSSRFEEFDLFLKRNVLPLGLFVQMTGFLWLGSKNVYVTMAYIYCFVPAFISLCIHIYRFGFISCLWGMTIGEKLISFLFLWIVVNYSVVLTADVTIEFVLLRLLTICLYLYAVRTVVLYSDKGNDLFLWSALVAAFFALLTLVYQYGILEKPIGVRAFGIEGYRVGVLDIEEFAYLVNPILAALYYGVFAGILFAMIIYRAYKNKWQAYIIILAIAVIVLFILLSGSRGPFLALVGMVGMGILLHNSPQKAKFLCILFVIGVVLVLIFNQKILALISSAFADGFTGRFTIWERTIEYISQYPLFGHGSFAEYAGPIYRGRIVQHPHSMILGLSFYWGIPAAIMYIAIVVWGLVTTYVHRDEPHMFMAGCILVFGFLGMLTDTFNLISMPSLEWLFFFFPLALCVSKKERYVFS